MPTPDRTADEQRAWAAVTARLAPLHRDLACDEYRASVADFGLAGDRIPTRSYLRFYAAGVGARLVPVDGLLEPRRYLALMARGAFPIAASVRDPARPEFSPAPDLIHDVVGHLPLLADPDVARLSRLLGRAGAAAGDAMLEQVRRLVWFTLEMGVIERRGRRTAYGAALLSSPGELARLPGVALRPFVAEEVVAAPADDQGYQDVLFSVPSLAAAADEIERWIDRQEVSLAETA